jgi:hypothetical protein
MYGRWEAGANLPQFFDLIRISLMFNVDPNYLMEGVLSDYMPVWLHRALKAGPQELLNEADYWKRQAANFSRASQRSSDEDDGGNEETV